jgi:hypothetical protein
MGYKNQFTPKKLDAKSELEAVVKHLNSLVVQLKTELTNIERSGVSTAATLIMSGSSTVTISGVSIGGYAAKSVDLTQGVHTVSFGTTFSGSFIYGVLSCIGTVQGQKVLVGYRILAVTNSDMTVEVDADCTLQHFEIVTT